MAPPVYVAGLHRYYEGSDYCRRDRFGASVSLQPRRCPSVGLGLDRPVTRLELVPNFLSLLRRQFSLLNSFELLTIPPLTTPIPFRCDRFVTLLQRRSLPRLSPGQTCFSRRDYPSRDEGSEIPRILPDRLGQIEFAYATDWSFTSGCSPPFLTKTQLPLLVTGR